MTAICASSINAGACPQSGNSNAVTRPLRGCRATFEHRVHRARENRSESSPRKMSTGQSTLSHTCHRIEVEQDRDRKAHPDARIEVKSEATIGVRDGAVLREMTPVGVAQRAERRMDYAQMRFDLVDGGKRPLARQIAADPAQCRRRHACAEVVEHKPSDRCARIRRRSTCR